MTRHVFRPRTLAVAAVTLLAGAALAALPSIAAHAATNSFRGVNWADVNDNFSDSTVVPSGLSTSDSYATTKAKATIILNDFTANLGTNTVRLPVNPSSVGTAWWNSYTGAIDAATGLGYKVILSYWEGKSSEDGKVDNTTTFWSMWSTVVAKYGSNPLVYFEPMNEPHGYSYTDWSAICATWLSNYSSVPKGRVVLSGTGYNQDVTKLGADSRFTGTLLSAHIYQFFSSNTTYSQFYSQISGEVGGYAGRTVIDEWGATMTTGLDYHASSSSSAFVPYLQAVSDYAKANSMGTVYWPGLRTNDTYSMETLSGTYPSWSMLTTNSSGRDLLLASWGVSGARTGTVTGLAGKCLDTLTPSSGNPKVVIQACGGASSQTWTLANGTLTSNGKCADATGAGTANGTLIIAFACNGGANQRWILNGTRLLNANSGTCLDVPGANSANGTQVELYSCNGGSNQSWTLHG
jgi:hypothetical protein